MSRLITTSGYVLFLLFILAANFWAIRHPEKLTPLPTLLARLMKQRATRLALAIIWWWLGWHFLYALL